MFERNSYLQKRAALHNLGFMRKLAALKSAALGTGLNGAQKGISNLLRYIQAGKGNNINWGKVLASATPEQRFMLRKALGTHTSIAAQGGDKAIFNDFSKANKTLDAILTQDYFRGARGSHILSNPNSYVAKNPNNLTGGYRNMGEFGRQKYTDTFTANPNGSLIYWGKDGKPVNLLKNEAYSNANGFFMPLVNGSGDPIMHGLDPTMGRRLHQWYRSKPGMEYLKAHGMGKPGVVNNQVEFIPMVPEDIQIMSMNPNVHNFALQRAQMTEQLRQQQAMAQTNQQMNAQAGGSAVAGGKKDPTFSDRLTGFATLGGLGFGIPWALGAFGRSDVPVGTADYDPARYYT